MSACIFIFENSLLKLPIAVNKIWCLVTFMSRNSILLLWCLIHGSFIAVVLNRFKAIHICHSNTIIRSSYIGRYLFIFTIKSRPIFWMVLFHQTTLYLETHFSIYIWLTIWVKWKKMPCRTKMCAISKINVIGLFLHGVTIGQCKDWWSRFSISIVVNITRKVKIRKSSLL